MLKMCIAYKTLFGLGLAFFYGDTKKGEKANDMLFFLFMKWLEHIIASFLENKQTNKYSPPQLAIL